MRLIQHKREAYWFYRFLSLGYDRWVNPLFWTPAMRARRSRAARLDEPDLTVLDAGAGTGFTTEGIVARVDRRQRDDARPEPAPARRARSASRRWRGCRKLLGDAEELPFDDRRFDRYVSAGSIEYWPDPQRGIAEAYRVTQARRGRAGDRARCRPATGSLRWLAELWMLFPTEAAVPRVVRARGLRGRRARRRGARLVPRPALAVRGRGQRAQDRGGRRRRSRSPAPPEDVGEPMGWRRRLVFAGRFALGSLAGFVFVPVGARRSRCAGAR